MNKKHLTKELELEIINYYLTPFTLSATVNHFHLQGYIVKEVLVKNNVPFHSKEINKQARIRKTVETNLKKYGVCNAFQSSVGKSRRKEFYADKDKVIASVKKNKQTKFEHYGNENYNNAEKTKATRIKKYGVENFFQNNEIHSKALDKARSNEAKTKKKQTCLEHFGVECSLSSTLVREKIMQTNLTKYGGVSPSCSMSITNKIQETKRTRSTFNISQPEEIFYSLLVKKFGSEDVFRQYKDTRYPFACDFYIKSLDTFIELNLMWTHGPHPFNKENKDDLALLTQWKEKAKFSTFYQNAIISWTSKDPIKIETAKNNNLNYQYFYSLDAALEFLNTI